MPLLNEARVGYPNIMTKAHPMELQAEQTDEEAVNVNKKYKKLKSVGFCRNRETNALFYLKLR